MMNFKEQIHKFQNKVTKMEGLYNSFNDNYTASKCLIIY